MDILRPTNESDRLAALHRYTVYNNFPHAPLERITNLAAHLFQVPLAAISLVEAYHQEFIAPRRFAPYIVKRADSFCTYTILGSDVMVVHDARRDTRVASSILVREHPHIRFYAGAPLITYDGFRLGALCIVDTEPRPILTNMERATLTHLAAIIMDEIELWKAEQVAQAAQEAYQQSEQRFRSMVQYSSDIITLLDADGIIRYEGTSVAQILGYPGGERIGQSALSLLHAGDRERVAQQLEYLIQHPGQHVSTVFRIQHASGAWVYVEAIGNNLLHDSTVGYVVVNVRDITERKRAEEQLLLLKAAMEHTSESVMITDAQLDAPGPHIVFVNAGFEAVTGYKSAEVIGRSPRMLQGEKTSPGDLRRLRTQLEQGKPFLGETTNYRKDGSEFTVEWSVSPVQDASGSISHYVSVQRDITARKRAEQLEVDQRRILEMVVESQPLPDIIARIIALVEHQFPYCWCTVLLRQRDQLNYIVAPAMPQPFFQVLQHFAIALVPSGDTTPYSPPDSVTITHLDIALHCEQCATLAQIYQVGVCWSVPILSSRNDLLGTCVVFFREPQVLLPEAHTLMFTVSRLATIVIEQRQLLDQLEYHAYHDVLTQLPNRLYFEKHFQAALERASVSGETVALLFIDLDRFKQVNDSLGHQIGDQLLTLVARRMEYGLQPTDVLARLGGDEFALLMPRLDSPQTAQEIAGCILAKFQEPFLIEGIQLFLTANIGISLYPHDGTDISTLQRNADIAMYRVKRRGVSGFQFYSSDMHADLLQPLLEQFELEEHLHKPTLFHELQLYYQPEIDLAQGTIIGVEALLRWMHPVLCMISPAKFIPVAERTGLIRPIGTWVLREACRQIATWQRAGYPAIFVAVNVSAAQFAEPDFVQTVEQILREHDLEPGWLELELTESLMLSDFEMTMCHLMELKQLGVRIALDDFGAGNTVLANLQRLPIDTLKIDKSFIDDLRLPHEQSQQTTVLIQTIVDLSHRLGIRTVAEGIETEEQSELIAQTGCDRVQGYWFGTPMPATELEIRLWKMDTPTTSDTYPVASMNGTQPLEGG